ncbi:MAG: hypothetical protein AAFR04_12345 [Pseudomonadota bacterium]
MSPEFAASALDPGGVPGRPPGARLTFEDAVAIWTARWMRVRPVDLCRRYGCDPRRLYEVWGEDTFIGSRAEALARLQADHPGLVDRVDLGTHRRIPRTIDPALQLDLFGEDASEA